MLKAESARVLSAASLSERKRNSEIGSNMKTINDGAFVHESSYLDDNVTIGSGTMCTSVIS